MQRNIEILFFPHLSIILYQGDSGGPLSYKDKISGKWFLIGVTSAVDDVKCLNGFSYYASLAFPGVVEWIKSIAGGDCSGF